jgi:secretion/DNA translocation related CpaE-like protein
VPDRPLLSTADPDLLDDLLRLCAVAGVEAQVAHEVAAARTDWLSAPFVLLGDDVSQGALTAGLPRRADVVLVTRDRGDPRSWERAAQLGAEAVVVLPDAETWLVDRLAGAPAGPVTEAATVSVLGGRGGAGASTLACALAVRGAARGRTLLLDGDPLGGGLDLVLGAEGVPGLRWPDLATATGVLSPSALVEALPRPGGLTLLSWDRGPARPLPEEAVRSVLAGVRRSHELLVADLPRAGSAPVVETVVAASDLVLLVVPAGVRAAAAAARVAAAVGAWTGDLRVVVRGPAPSGLTAEDVATSLGLPLAGWLRPEPGLAAALERGEPPGGSGRGPLAELSAALLDLLPGVVRRAA